MNDQQHEERASAACGGRLPFWGTMNAEDAITDLRRQTVHGNGAAPAESVPILKESLADIGKVQFVEMSYDGSMVAFLVAGNPKFETVLQVQLHLQSPRSGKSSALVLHDKTLVVTLETGTASRMERTTSWLREFELLVE